jgi:hypothetical protein
MLIQSIDEDLILCGLIDLSKGRPMRKWILDPSINNATFVM